MSPRTSLFTAALSSLAIMSAAAAAPAAAQETRSIEVEYSDLDLASPKGAERLQSRIELAARRVCGAVDMRSIADRRAHNTCVAGAIGGTRNAVVTLLAEAKSPNALARNDRTLTVTK